jgi:hypothetical protein
MSLSSADTTRLADLLTELQDHIDPKCFETLSAALIGQLVGVSIAVAKSGFQHGADAGPAGRQGRRFRIETKRYASNTTLSDRELLGELDHALERDEALESWILVATRDVPEQLEQALMKKGERIGVPVIVVDWKKTGFPTLAALCTADPDTVEALGSTKAAALARLLQSVAAPTLDSLRKDFEAWSPGFNGIRKSSHRRLAQIWTSPQTSQAEFGQNVAGGSRGKKVRRQTAHASLSSWWGNGSGTLAPAVLLGADGVGKTWAALDWMFDQLAELPVVLVVSSSTAAELSSTSLQDVAAFVARRLYEITGVRDEQHWKTRLERLLARPEKEGPVLLLFFDGMNQESTVPWLRLVRMLQDSPFSGRVRVLMSTRNYHYSEKLGSLRGLVEAPFVTTLDVYEAGPGGELDQMLAFEGLKQADIPPDLLDIARTPRLFDLLVRFRMQLVAVSQVTLHRLLWEYGRDTLQSRSEKSFSENDWRAWLQTIARCYLAGTQRYSTATLADTTARADLTATEIQARLSDIIDGKFAVVGPAGEVTLSPVVVTHALGATALYHLEAESKKGQSAIDEFLSSWLDPIAGLDVRAEILRAAVSIAIEQPGTSSAITGALLSAWLLTQNIPEEHRSEIRGLAPAIVEPLLIAIQNAKHHSQSSARIVAINALRTVPRDDMAALQLVIVYARKWFCQVSRDLSPAGSQWQQASDQRSARWLQRIGVDAPGTHTILGTAIELLDENTPRGAMAVPSLLEGFPLETTIPVLEAAALNHVVRGNFEGWDGLRWLVLFNEVDQKETAESIRSLSDALCHRSPEALLDPRIPGRIAALLLWLTGEDRDDVSARKIDSRIDASFDYEKDYLLNPGQSFFTLERRHARHVLLDQGLPLHVRYSRTKELWLDPTFDVPPAFASELDTAFAAMDMDGLSTGRSITPLDHAFETATPVLARCAEKRLAELIRRKLAGFAKRPMEHRYAGALNASEHLLLSNDQTSQDARTIRLQDNGWSSDHTSIGSMQLLMIEIVDKPGIDQWISIIDADLPAIYANFSEILNPISAADGDALIARYETGTEKQLDHLVSLFNFHEGPFSSAGWGWLSQIAFGQPPLRAKIAFDTLACADRLQFGRELLARNWSWDPSGDQWSNHFGSMAMIAAGSGLPFDQLAPRLAPWTVLTAVRQRGDEPSEVRFATVLLGAALNPSRVAPDLGSLITMDRSSDGAGPFGFWLTVKEENDALSMKLALDPESMSKARRAAADVAIQRIKLARTSGASLFNLNVPTEDCLSLVHEAPDFVDQLLDGVETRSEDFRRRVALAEGFYLALCEALFGTDPAKAVILWRSLKNVLLTRFIGTADVDELTLIVFRAKQSSESEALMDELLDLRNAVCDKDLLDLATAATLTQREDWLKRVIDSDEASDSNWRQQRALVTRGFLSGNSLPLPDAWPDGPIASNRQVRAIRSARFRCSEACASHWLNAYWEATTAESAFAAWVLFEASADRRAWIKLDAPSTAGGTGARLNRLKRIHISVNTGNLEKAMAERESKLDREFLGITTVPGIGPWGKLAN